MVLVPQVEEKSGEIFRGRFFDNRFFEEFSGGFRKA
jgi:hypothetical protein